MIEIIVLIFITREIGRLAEKKGLKSGLWKLYNVLGWLAAEIAGAFIGILIFGTQNHMSVFLVAILFAVTSYFLIKGYLSRLPDAGFEDEINNIGRNE